MFKAILVPTDGSVLAEKAVSAAIVFAKEVNARLVVLAVADYKFPAAIYEDNGGAPTNLAMYEAKARMLAQQHVDKAREAARSADVPCETVVTLSSTPYQQIIEVAAQQGCDIIFMASHGLGGLQSLLIGSETQKVLAHSNIPVLVFR